MKKILLLGLISILAISMGCRRRATSSSTPSSSARTISVTVTGLAGSGLVLQNNGGDDLTVNAVGTSSFASTVANNGAYAVTVKSSPMCPTQLCTVTNGSGTATANVTVTVACTTYSNIALVTHSWDDDVIRITSGVQSLTDGFTATPTTISGPTTTLAATGFVQNLKTDKVREMIYVLDDYKIKVWENGLSTSGDVAPDRTISPTGVNFRGFALDDRNDRLYAVSTSNIIYVFEDASTVDGNATPDHSFTISISPEAMNYDPVNDRLYAGSWYGEYVIYENVSSATSGTSPTYSASLRFNTAGSIALSSIAPDGCSDRLYVTTRNTSDTGYNVFGISTTTMSDFSSDVNVDTTNLVRKSFSTAMNALVDHLDTFYIWQDSPTNVTIYNNSSTRTGTLTTVDKTIHAVVNHGYGLDFLTY